MTPHDGGIVVGVVSLVVGIGGEAPQLQVFQQSDHGIDMHVEVSVVLVLFHRQQRVGIVDPQGFRHLVIAAVGIGAVGEGGVEGLCRVDQLLPEGQVMVLLDGA